MFNSFVSLLCYFVVSWTALSVVWGMVQLCGLFSLEWVLLIACLALGIIFGIISLAVLCVMGCSVNTYHVLTLLSALLPGVAGLQCTLVKC